MEQNGWFFRTFFFGISALFAITYECTLPHQEWVWSMLKGLGIAIGLSAVCFFIEQQLKKYTLRTFNTALAGLMIGLVIGSILVMSVKAVLNTLLPSFEMANGMLLGVYLASIYLGIVLTFSSAESWWLSIPFVRLAPASQTNKKDILVDLSALEDSRLIELARSGLLDHQLVIPTFIVKEIQKSMESADELTRNRGRKCYEHLKRLESLPDLGLQIKEFHFQNKEQDFEELAANLTKAAKLIQGYILTSQEPSALRSEDAVVTINIEAIAASLKPGAQRGEVLGIKIQRLGKEPKQGVGYLEDGTMVVVNGGGEFLGQTIRTQVLSQKYSSSGKIIFCNAIVSGEEKRTNGIESAYHQPQMSSVY